MLLLFEARDPERGGRIYKTVRPCDSPACSVGGGENGAPDQFVSSGSLDGASPAGVRGATSPDAGPMASALGSAAGEGGIGSPVAGLIAAGASDRYTRPGFRTGSSWGTLDATHDAAGKDVHGHRWIELEEVAAAVQRQSVVLSVHVELTTVEDVGLTDDLVRAVAQHEVEQADRQVVVQPVTAVRVALHDRHVVVRAVHADAVVEVDRRPVGRVTGWCSEAGDEAVRARVARSELLVVHLCGARWRAGGVRSPSRGVLSGGIQIGAAKTCRHTRAPTSEFLYA